MTEINLVLTIYQERLKLQEGKEGFSYHGKEELKKLMINVHIHEKTGSAASTERLREEQACEILALCF